MKSKEGAAAPTISLLNPPLIVCTGGRIGLSASDMEDGVSNEVEGKGVDEWIDE